MRSTMRMGVNLMKNISIKRGIFELKAKIVGKGAPSLVIGSHIYYPRVFSKNLQEHLQMIFLDTRAFVKESPDFASSDFSIQKFIEDIEAFRQLLKLDKFIVIGHSIHAFIALEYAKRFPDRVSHLVMIASSPIVGPKLYMEADRYFEESVCPDRKQEFQKQMDGLKQESSPSFIQRMLAFGPKLWFDFKFDATSLWKDVEINFLGANIVWGSMFSNTNVASNLTSVCCPIFLALGRYDYFNPPSLWEKYRKFVKNLRIRIFESSGHTPQLEQDNIFDSELLEWLDLKTSDPQDKKE